MTSGSDRDRRPARTPERGCSTTRRIKPRSIGKGIAETCRGRHRSTKSKAAMQSKTRLDAEMRRVDDLRGTLSARESRIAQLQAALEIANDHQARLGAEVWPGSRRRSRNSNGAQGLKGRAGTIWALNCLPHWTNSASCRTAVTNKNDRLGAEERRAEELGRALSDRESGIFQNSERHLRVRRPMKRDWVRSCRVRSSALNQLRERCAAT